MLCSVFNTTSWPAWLAKVGAELGVTHGAVGVRALVGRIERGTPRSPHFSVKSFLCRNRKSLPYKLY